MNREGLIEKVLEILRSGEHDPSEVRAAAIVDSLNEVWDDPYLVADRPQARPPARAMEIPADLDDYNRRQELSLIPDPSKTGEPQTPLEVWRTSHGELETPLSVSARFTHEHAIEMRNQPKIRYARCGNCSARLALTDDPTENHHIAMRHKQTCGQPSAGQWNDEEFARQLEEFNRQPHVILLKAQHAADVKRMALERADLDAAQLTAGPPDSDPLSSEARALDWQARQKNRTWWSRIKAWFGR